MTSIPTLKYLAYKRLEHPHVLRSIKTIPNCPFDVARPLLSLMTPVQLLAIEERTPRLLYDTLPLWKSHTLKAFPSIVDTHEIDGDDIDWRVVYQDMQDERKERELQAREKLRANYNQIASGKSDRKIQVIQKAVPTKQRIRSSGLSSSQSAATPVKGASIMGKAVKASMNSFTRQFSGTSTRPGSAVSSSSSPIRSTSGAGRPGSNSAKNAGSASSPVMKLSLPQTRNASRPITSKFLVRTNKR